MKMSCFLHASYTLESSPGVYTAPVGLDGVFRMTALILDPAASLWISPAVTLNPFSGFVSCTTGLPPASMTMGG
jgi:hypothetical protein